MSVEGGDQAQERYFQLLDDVFADSVLEHHEALALFQKASELGMSRDGVRSAHERYVQALLRVAYLDGYYTEMEARHLEAVARALEVDELVLDDGVEPLALYPRDLRGKSFCFSGQPQGRIADQPLRTTELAELAEKAGLQLQPRVDKNTDFLVVSGSRPGPEVERAQELKVPLVSEQVFWNWLGVQVL